MTEYTPKFLRNFWKKVRKSDEPDGCWEWTAYRNEDGYGSVKYQKKVHRSHRMSYEIAYGPIPDNLRVCHKCDHPCCVRPDHLFLGTQKDNVQDAWNKGRAHHFVGEDHGMCRFSDETVQAVRDAWDSGSRNQSELSRRFGMSRGHIRQIVFRQQRK